MIWNWERKKWPEFSYGKHQAAALEKDFLLKTGKWMGLFSHLNENDQDFIKVALLGSEAWETSHIEGEILNRDSVQSSIQRQLGLKCDRRSVEPSEQGIAELTVDVYRHFSAPLTHAKLHGWHEMIMNGRRDVHEIGKYRTDPEAMQIVSGAIHHPKVHYEAPPSDQVPEEMESFLQWFNESQTTLPSTVRSAVAHLHFESIHPYEDGNGRIGRAIAEYAISQSLDQPVLLSLSQVISKNKKRYYDELAKASKTLEITDWVNYFCKLLVESQETSFDMVHFVLGKTRLLDRLRDDLNPRQEKALLRMFAEGLDGFKGGLSSSNYQSITGASSATATRDLVDLVDKGALIKTGKQRGTRYSLPPRILSAS